jgi:hypothetical protein
MLREDRRAVIFDPSQAALMSQRVAANGVVMRGQEEPIQPPLLNDVRRSSQRRLLSALHIGMQQMNALQAQFRGQSINADCSYRTHRRIRLAVERYEFLRLMIAGELLDDFHHPIALITACQN